MNYNQYRLLDLCCRACDDINAVPFPDRADLQIILVRMALDFIEDIGLRPPEVFHLRWHVSALSRMDCAHPDVAQSHLLWRLDYFLLCLDHENDARCFSRIRLRTPQENNP